MLKAVVFLLAASVSGVAVAQEPILFDRIDSQDGLSHNSVFSILQDQQGFLWFGTHDGLNRYDGYEFVVYRQQAGNSIFSMLEDDDGSLWLGTRNGLNRYDPDTDSFERYRPPESSRFTITSMAIDAVKDLWLRAESDSAVYRFDPDRSEFEAFPLDAMGHGAASVGTDAQGRPWVTSVSATHPVQLMVHRVDAESGRLKSLPLAGTYFTNEHWILPPLLAGPSGRFWIGAWDQGWSEEARETLSSIPDVSSYVTALCEDHQGRLWIGTDEGLYLYDPETEDLRHILLDASGSSWIANFVRALYVDRAGTLWVGTNSGLYRHDPNVKSFTFLDPAESSPIMAIAADDDGAVWAGTLGAGLLHIDLVAGTTRLYRLTHPDSPSTISLIWGIHVGNDAVWLATSSGIARFTPRTGEVSWLPTGSASGFFTIQPSLDGGSLIAGGEEVLRIDPETDAVKVLFDPAMSNRLGQPVIEAVHVDSSAGIYWLASERGLFRYDVETDDIEGIPEVQRELDSVGIWSLHQDGDGKLWLGTDAGMARFDPATSNIERFVDSAGSGSVVYSILEDDQRQFWLGTSRGLVRFDPDDGSFRHFDTADGIGNTEFNRRSSLRLDDGRMLFGGLDGITIFNPTAIRENPYIPPVALTQVQVGNQNGVRTIHPEPGNGLVLTHDDKSLALDYAALSYTNPSKNRYRYRLDGFETAWVDAGTRRRVDYTNIPPGRYVFRVQGSNNDGLWNTAGVALPISVLPPFWQTPWFRGLLLIGTLGLLYAGYQYRVRQIVDMERLRLRIAADLHDDIGSKLSGMALLSEMLEADPEIPTSHKEDLAEIGVSAREIVGDLRDIVWFIDPEHDESGKTLVKMEQTARRLLSGTEYSFTVSDIAPLEGAGMDVRRNVFLIYKEALHNVVRHARAAAVTVRMGRQGGSWVLAVADDGVGFDPGESTMGSGVKNMQRRAREIGAMLVVSSEFGGGTRVELTIPARPADT